MKNPLPACTVNTSARAYVHYMNILLTSIDESIDPVLPISIARCHLLAAISVMLKFLRLLFAARIELINNRLLASVKTKTTSEAREA